MAPSTGYGMTGIPPNVPRRAGGHAADRLREQLAREYGIVVPDDRPDPAHRADPDSGIESPDDAGPAEADFDADERPDPGGQEH